MTRNEFDEAGGELWMEAEDKLDKDGVEQVDVNMEQLVVASVSVPSRPLFSLNNGSSETYDRRRETGQQLLFIVAAGIEETQSICELQTPLQEATVGVGCKVSTQT